MKRYSNILLLCMAALLVACSTDALARGKRNKKGKRSGKNGGAKKFTVTSKHTGTVKRMGGVDLRTMHEAAKQTRNAPQMPPIGAAGLAELIALREAAKKAKTAEQKKEFGSGFDKW